MASIFRFTPSSAVRFSLPGVVILILLAFSTPASGQQGIPSPGRSSQQIPQRDTSQALETGDLPDTIRIHRVDPRFPVGVSPVSDSALSLRYVRYDPVQAYSPDYLSLNSIGQPARLQPVLGTPYTRLRLLTSQTHPAYQAQPAPFYTQNLPYTYTAYDQGGEINDGQIRVLLGRSFVNGWRVGANYHRIYQGGERNRYRESRAQRIAFGITLAHVPDSSHHRSYGWIDLNNYGFNNAGGYAFQLSDPPSEVEEPFEAVPLNQNVRTEGKFSSYHILHRYFLAEQLDSLASGWAASAEASYHQGFHRTSAQAGNSIIDSAQFAPYVIDDRGLRFQVEQRSLLGEVQLGYFANPRNASQFAFSFEAGVYGGRQGLRAAYLDDTQDEFLFGLSGVIRGSVFKAIQLAANADLALGSRAGEGKIEGSLSWDYRGAFGLQAHASLERSQAPFSATFLGVNDMRLFSPNLPITTHTQVGASLSYAPLSASVTGNFDVYSEAHLYSAQGDATSSTGEQIIPTLSVEVPVQVGPVVLDNRVVLRTSVQTMELRLPAYTGQHSLYYRADLFEKALSLMVGVDGRLVSPSNLYTYAPLTSAFSPQIDGQSRDFQYNLDAFLAIKVQSFKAFIRVDNMLVSDRTVLPASVAGYPVVRGNTIVGTPGIVRFGVAFFLLN